MTLRKIYSNQKKHYRFKSKNWKKPKRNMMNTSMAYFKRSRKQLIRKCRWQKIKKRSGSKEKKPLGE